MWTKILTFILALFVPRIVSAKKEKTLKKLTSYPQYNQENNPEDVALLKEALNKVFGSKLDPSKPFGPLTFETVRSFQLRSIPGSKGSGKVGPSTIAALGLEIEESTAPPVVKPPGVQPVYPKPHKFHPRFDHLLKAPYTHLHPIDVLRSVAGEKEIKGSKDNPLIAHFHEHSGNLGTHSDDKNDYSDEVAHCSSALNWAADMAGCEKTNNALASSWSKYGNPRQGDWVEEGDIIHIKTGSQNHVTLCNKRFNRKSAKSFEGFGSNQGNSIKTSIYSVTRIVSCQAWKPKPGTVLAPIGILGMKPVPASGSGGESTR